MDKRYEIPSDTQSEVDVESDDSVTNDLNSDVGVNLNDTAEADDLMGSSSKVNIDEMQPELDLNAESSEYYTRGDEAARQEGEQFMQEHPDLFTESTISDNPPAAETPDSYHNMDADTVVFGRYNDSEAGKPYTEVGEEEGHAYFDSERYEADIASGRLEGESEYDATGNSDFVDATGEKEKIYTDNPIDAANPLGEGGTNEFNQIQEATGITVDDIHEDDDGRYHVDTDGVWIGSEDRNAEFNDAGDDVVSDNYVSPDDIVLDDTPTDDVSSIDMPADTAADTSVADTADIGSVDSSSTE